MSARRSDAFELALDEARQKDRAPDDDGSGSARGLRLRAGVAFGPALGSGGAARFDLALDWTDEPADRPAAPPQPPAREAAKHSSDTSAEVAAELGLAAPLTLGQLASRWRNFVWRNHPDRQPLEQRERANARVAIANALYERARRKLAKTG
jgi:hypothetical protein